MFHSFLLSLMKDIASTSTWVGQNTVLISKSIKEENSGIGSSYTFCLTYNHVAGIPHIAIVFNRTYLHVAGISHSAIAFDATNLHVRPVSDCTVGFNLTYGHVALVPNNAVLIKPSYGHVAPVPYNTVGLNLSDGHVGLISDHLTIGRHRYASQDEDDKVCS